MIFDIEYNGDSYAVDVLSALAITRVTEAGTGYDADASDLPTNLADRIADHLAEQWATQCETRLVEPAERNLARWVARALLPEPDDDGDESHLDEVLRVRWTGGRRAA